VLEGAGFANAGLWTVPPLNSFTNRGPKSLPSFFVIGPPRTGTSWVHQVLRTRAILPFAIKETRFFDSRFERGFEWYLGQFPNCGGNSLVTGEIAPTYFACPDARTRIANAIPHAKVVCIFRNPVERIVSLYRLKRAYGFIPWKFDAALYSDRELLESAKYATHLKGWRKALGPTQVLPTLYDDMHERPQNYVDMLADFVGIPKFRLSRAEMRYVNSSGTLTVPRSYRVTRAASYLADWLKTKKLGGPVATVRDSVFGRFLLASGTPFDEPSPEFSSILYDLVKDEIEELQELLGCDLSHWRSSHRVQTTPGAGPL